MTLKFIGELVLAIRRNVENDKTVIKIVDDLCLLDGTKQFKDIIIKIKESLNKTLEKYNKESDDKKIGEVLIDKGSITKKELNAALKQQKEDKSD